MKRDPNPIVRVVEAAVEVGGSPVFSWQESFMLTASEQRVLGVFRQFLVGPGEMLCFNSAQLKAYRLALPKLIDRGFLVRERFKGAYSLTDAGFEAVKNSP